MKALLVMVFASLLVSGYRNTGDRSPLVVRYNIEEGSVLSIQGTTNINSFECFSRQTFNQQSIAIRIDSDRNLISFDNAVLQLRVKELNCDNSKINADLCSALQAEQFPFITIELHDAVIDRATSSGETLDLRIAASLRITDQKRRIELRTKGKILSDGRYQFMALKALKMSDFGVDPPTALFGLIKVNDEIKINFNLITRLHSEG
ncbi:MAG: YceI family protein [Candidatus Kapabacteria bacterium]|nr:YceI family protein [Candidatus Kapabacteria bacterium]